MSWFDGLLHPIMVVVAWIMVGFHSLFTELGLDPDGGTAWTLSIVGLVIVIRILLIPLFFKQIKASRGMQMLAPEMQAIQKKYKGKSDPASREAMSRETMELYRKHGTNPFASCLPILLQSPIFFALFRVLSSLDEIANGSMDPIGPMSVTLAASAEQATILGAPLSSWFLQDGASINTKIVSALLIVAMSVTTFLTQRQLTMKNMPPSALEGPMAQQQKILLYVLPLIFAFSGVNFPIGVLIYWTTTNLWSMGQQFYTIRRMPAPGSQAEKAMLERKQKRAAAKGIVEDAPETTVIVDERPRGQRQQPVRKDRAKPRNPLAEPTGGVQDAPTDASSDAPSAGPTASKASGAKPAPGGAKPASGSAKPASGSAKPASGGGKPRTSPSKPATPGAQKPKGSGNPKPKK